MLEPPVEIGIIALILDDSAGMRHSRPIAGKERADLGKAEPADDVSQIHRHLAREGRARRAPRRCPQIVNVNLEHRCDGRIDDPS